MRISLPLFPLNTVLYPSIPLTHQINEEHYHSLIQHCLNTREPFGIVLHRTNQVYGTSFYTIGCSASIQDCTQLGNGHYQIRLQGDKRFQVRYIEQEAPYMRAQIEYLPEETISLSATANANIMRAMYQRYWEALASTTGYQHELETLPKQVHLLSYWMADRLQVSAEQKQRWLEYDLYARLRDLNHNIRAELALLPKHIKNRKECLPFAHSLN